MVQTKTGHFSADTRKGGGDTSLIQSRVLYNFSSSRCSRHRNSIYWLMCTMPNSPKITTHSYNSSSSLLSHS
eukprot:1320384-Ditylum_brightwellii.AAC.1